MLSYRNLWCYTKSVGQSKQKIIIIYNVIIIGTIQNIISYRGRYYSNILNIDSSTYCGIEKQLGLLTDDGLNRLLEQLQRIADTRRNACMIEYDGLLKVIKLIRTSKIERDTHLGNILTMIG